MTNRHKVFVSYHHSNDGWYRNKFESLFAGTFDIMVSKSVQIGDIDPDNQTEYVRQQIRDNYIADATVIVVLIGTETWKRKYVDWEIYSGLRDTTHNPRCGLLGIFLPTHPAYGDSNYNKYTIPPRLFDNVECGFARLLHWTEDPHTISREIHSAFSRRNNIDPDLSRQMFGKNRTGHQW